MNPRVWVIPMVVAMIAAAWSAYALAVAHTVDWRVVDTALLVVDLDLLAFCVWRYRVARRRMDR